MLIDGPITSEMIDSSGEVLKLDGLDISDFLEGKAWANWEHDNSSSENILGHFVYARKISSEKDCENDRQKLFWNQLKTPFLYGICELMDDEDHPGAVAVAAMMRYFKKKQEPVMVGFSIEGSTLKRDDNVLERTVGRRVAITLRPCNRQCWVDMLPPEQAKDMISKSESSKIATVQVDSAIVADDHFSPEIDLKIAVLQLQKTLTAGMGNAAPSTLTGGSALSAEHMVTRTQLNTLKSAIRDWDRKRPLIEVVKAALPEVSDQYVDHFVDLANDLSLKKSGKPLRMPRIGAERVAGRYADDEQKRLVNGLYLHNDDVDEVTGQHPVLRVKNDEGNSVIVKMPNNDHPGMSDAERTAAYYILAKKFFNMGAHVPTTTRFLASDKDAPWAREYARVAPSAGEWSAMQHIDGKNTLEAYDDYMKHLEHNRPAIHKLALMDAITGTSDRHHGNAMIDPHGNLYHIDNDYAFTGGGNNSFHLEHVGDDAVHPEAADWLRGLDHRKLLYHMTALGMNRDDIKRTAKRLVNARNLSTSGRKLRDIIETLTNDQDTTTPVKR